MANRLIHEQSPYLLQHAHNPVDWFPWGDEPFKRALEAHKPVLVSIGYAACHWCHVMERESFEQEEVAAFMNEHFVCIKVDREEHPDVDHLYMDAVQAISGSGGWPLNVFVTPERIPFFGGTYYPPRSAYGRISWMELLDRMAHIWKDQQEEVKAQTGQMVAYLRQASQVALQHDGGPATAEDGHKMALELLIGADKSWGGFGQAPKFPSTLAISFLLEHHHYQGYQPALDHALRSLDAMIEGGIYDQLGGGFSRYSTDREWLAPHFEKMLYDNALLLLSLCDAYQLSQAPRYARVIEETIGFVERELRHPSGGFYSALDADSEGVEGKFYTWTWEEWQELVPGGDALAEAWFGLREAGNWEHTNILHRRLSLAELAAGHGISEAEAERHIGEIRKLLFQVREQRVRPQTDDKCLLSWNALMNLAYTRAGIVLDRPEYLERAEAHMEWMLGAFVQEGALMHTWKDGRARIPAKLEDFAYLIQAMIRLGSASGHMPLIPAAGEWTRYAQAHFVQDETGFFYFSSDLQQDIPVRKVDVYDGATPSANAVMAHNLLLLGMMLERSDWLEQGELMLARMSGHALRYPASFGYWAQLLQRQAAGFKTAVITGPQAGARHKEILQIFAPQLLSLPLTEEKNELPVQKNRKRGDETLIFVCTTQACLPPVESLEEVSKLLKA